MTRILAPVDGKIAVTVRVSRVYCGPKGLLGQTFGDEAIGTGAELQVSAARADFKEGERAIWSVKRHAEDGLLVARGDDLGFQYRVRKADNNDYEKYREMAEAVEAVNEAPAERRRALLRRFAYTDSACTSWWAAGAAACNYQSSKAARDQFAEFAADPKLGRFPMAAAGAWRVCTSARPPGCCGVRAAGRTNADELRCRTRCP